MAGAVGRPDSAGRALVLLHGAGGNHRLWTEVFASLRSQGVPVVALDLPGHGANDSPLRHRVSDYAADVAGMLEGMGVEQYAVAGHSLGGAVALTLGARGGRRLLGLGAVSTGARLPVDPRILDGVRESFSSTVENLARFIFARGTDAGRLREAAETMKAAGAEAVYADFAACAAYGLTEEELRAIEVPAEVVCGACDVLTPPALSEELTRALPQGQLTLIPGCGHMPLTEAPAELAAALARLWRRAVPAG